MQLHAVLEPTCTLPTCLPGVCCAPLQAQPACVHLETAEALQAAQAEADVLVVAYLPPKEAQQGDKSFDAFTRVAKELRGCECGSLRVALAIRAAVSCPANRMRHTLSCRRQNAAPPRSGPQTCNLPMSPTMLCWRSARQTATRRWR